MTRLQEASRIVKDLSEKSIEQTRAMRMVKSMPPAQGQGVQPSPAALVSPSGHMQSASALGASALGAGASATSPSAATPAQPDFDSAHNAGAGASPGTTYTRQTYDDGASIYTGSASIIGGGAAAGLGASAYAPYGADSGVGAGAGAGAGSAAPQSAPPAPRALMSTESPGELFDPDVIVLFDKHRSTVATLWSFYTAMSRGEDGQRGTARGIDVKRFVTLLEDYDICPTFVTKKELKQIFVATSRAHGGAPAPGANPDDPMALPALSNAAFIEALGRTALVALAKPAFTTLYPTAFDKVKVLLEMWGISDPRKLREVQDAVAEGGPRTGAPGSVAGRSRTSGTTGASARKSSSRRGTSGKQ
jgi:hypothetical protein